MAGWTKTSSASNAASGTTLAIGSIPAGSFIRVCTYGGTAAGTVSDDSGDSGAASYALAKSQANTVDGGTAQEFWLYPTVNLASRTITAGASVHIAVSWWIPPTGTTGVAVSASNGANTGAGADAVSVSSGNVTAAVGDLVAGFCDSSNTFTANWTAGGTSAGGTWATDVGTTEGTHVVYAQFVVATSAGTFASQPVYGHADALASIVVVYAASVTASDTGTARTSIQIPNRMVGPTALRNLYRTATPTTPTADASQLPLTIGAPPAPLKLPNPYVGPMALRQVTKLPPPPLPTIGVTDSIGFATTGASAPSFAVTDTAGPTVVLPFRISNRNVGPMALRQAFRQPGFQSVNTAGGVTQAFGFNTTGSSAPAFALAGMTDTFVFATTGASSPVFTLAGMSDTFGVSTTGHSAPVFTLAGMTDVFVVSATGKSTPAFTVVSIPAGGSTDIFAFAATGSSTTRFGLIFFSLNREGDRVSREAGLGLGSMYEYANYSTATSASSAEHSRVNAGVGLGAGSHIDFTNAAAKTDEATTEGNRVKDLAGIGGGSQANL